MQVQTFKAYDFGRYLQNIPRRFDGSHQNSPEKGCKNEKEIQGFYRNPPQVASKLKCHDLSSSSIENIEEAVTINPKFYKKCGCPSVLIVDDQYINRYIIKQFCSKYAIPCALAEDGHQAVETIKQEYIKHCCDGITLVLMDLNMPVLGGIEATKQIMKLKQEFKMTGDIKIVAVTAFP